VHGAKEKYIELISVCEYEKNRRERKHRTRRE
jgi:hypothetical protein